MTRILVCLTLACLILTCSAFAEVRVMPRIPTTRTPVTLYYRHFHGCPANALGAAVRRAGAVIHVYLSVEKICIVSSADVSQIAVPLGALEAGDYEIRTTLNGEVADPVVPLRILDATTFPLSPPGVQWFPVEGCGGTLKAPDFPGDLEARVGDAPPTVVQDSNFLFSGDKCPATPTLTDVQITMPDGEKALARNAFTFYEENGPTRAFVFENVFIPVFDNARGATGDWRSELALRAMDPMDREVLVNAPWKPRIVVNDQRTVVAASEIGRRPGGFYLEVVRNGVEKFRPELSVWNADVPGVIPQRIPVVREQDWLAGASRIDALPIPAGTRVSMRVYAPDDDLEFVSLRGRGLPQQIKPIRQSPDRPRVASIEFTTDAAGGLPATSFAGEPFGTRYWILITWTDSVTHQLVVLIPRQEEARS